MEPNNAQTTGRHESLDVFDDEFAVDDFDGIADGIGFAPGRVQDDEHDEDDGSEPPVRSVHAHMADLPMTATTPTSTPRFGTMRNSIRKPRRDSDNPNPFTSAEDEDDGASFSGRTPSIRSQSTVAYAPGISHRSLSSTSSRPFAPSQTPLHAGNGPSHPYAMYPQGTNLARTPSVSTTTSTVRAPQRPSMAAQRPTHPYSMYPQGVSEGDDDEDNATSHPQANIPVGFPGRTSGYHRQQGPEGEEQDIIGVDGHTEQLPPYSEYPEDGAPKHIVLPGETAAIAPVSATHLTLPPMPAQPQSMSDASSRADAQASGFASMEQLESNDSTLTTPKRWTDKTWKEKKKTKFCGIPFWWIMLSAGVLAFIAAVLGGAIGGFMTSQKKHAEQQHNQAQAHTLPSSTNLPDASPIPTSSTGTPPATGTFALSLGQAEATQAACLTNSSYADAWGCSIPSPQSLAIVIEQPPSGSDECEGAYLFDASNNNDYTNVTYGAQMPTTSFSQFLTVTDIDDTALGPAFYFEAFYDKLVVVPAASIPYSGSNSNSKRDPSFTVPPEWHTQHQIAAGEQPWFCYWNSTFVEGFIYTNNYTGSNGNTASFSISPSSASPAMASSAFAASASQTTSSKLRRTYQGADYSTLSAFGYVVKIEERRTAGSPQPYCQKMQILDDGTAGVVVNTSTGQPIVIDLSEEDPSITAYQTATSGEVPGGCHCQWWSGA